MTVAPSITHLASAGELVAAKKFGEAEAAILRALDAAPADVKALTLLALVRYKLGRLDEARATYRELVAAAPNDADARRNLGLLALKLGRLDEALPELEMAVRLAPGDSRAWSYLGYGFAKRGEVVEAAAAFRRAGQDALAQELEQAAKAQRPGPARAGGTVTGGADVDFGRGGDLGRAGQSRPVALAPPLPPLTGEPTSIGRRRRATQPPLPGPPTDGPDAAVEPPRRFEAEPAPLLTYVRGRLGQALPPPLPRGALRLVVGDEVYVRSDAVLAGTGSLRWERGVRRAQGRMTGEPLGTSAAVPFFRLTGAGAVWVAGAPDRWMPLRLADDVLYVREDRVLAFEGALAWEAGYVDSGVAMLQFRGRGVVALDVPREPLAVEVGGETPTLLSAARLFGWVGRLVPHAAAIPPDTAGPRPFQLACDGEGIVLLEAGG
ncbi:MAG TPA: tetratricopeptide repeat protein [Polyangia bacterium]|nr:tetratricopeptide repeat protein [Polyangia bacterium]